MSPWVSACNMTKIPLRVKSLLHFRQAQAAITDSDGEETQKAVCCNDKELSVFLECEVAPFRPV